MSAEVVSLAGARLAFGDRVLWDHLDLTVSAGEFIAILGPNGTGKTSLLKVLLGQLPLSAGTALIDGAPVEKGSDRIGYVPQHRAVDRGLSLRGQDLVRLGVDGHRWGLAPLRKADRIRRRAAVNHALAQVRAEKLARVGVGVMSGGELQRVRIAQARASPFSLHSAASRRLSISSKPSSPRRRFSRDTASRISVMARVIIRSLSVKGSASRVSIATNRGCSGTMPSDLVRSTRKRRENFSSASGSW